MEIQNLIDRYEAGIDAMHQALRGTQEELLDVSPGPGKWTIRQIVVHVADADVVTAMRFRQIAAEPGAKLIAWDQDVWAGKLNYEQQPLEDALQAFTFVRRYTANMLRNIPASAWQQTGDHSEKGPVKLLDLVEYMGEHAFKHAEQIRAIRQKFAGAARA
jgi:hypothetical protein